MSSGRLVDQGIIMCNCACAICLAGGCCMDPNRYRPPTIQTTDTGDIGLGWACTSSGHDFAIFNEGTLYCRKCGEFRQLAALFQPEADHD